MAKQTNTTIEQPVETTVETQETKQLMTADELNKLLEKHGQKKSPVIRELAKLGFKTSEITKIMQTVFPKFLYQHARNVLNQKFNGDRA
jgi:hypothetical protein